MACRSEAYIGVLIDDLVTKGTIEPYRMFTSRAEYRLLLRQDNADLRLSKYGRDLGLLKSGQFEQVQRKQDAISETIAALNSVYVEPDQINDRLRERGTSPIQQKESLLKLLRRPEIGLADLRGYGRLDLWENWNAQFWQKVAEQVEIETKYEGFINRQKSSIDRFDDLEEKRLPANVDYGKLLALSSEAREKLNRIKPASFGQASRISGVSPADITTLLVYARKGFRHVSRETPEELEMMDASTSSAPEEI